MFKFLVEQSGQLEYIDVKLSEKNENHEKESKGKPRNRKHSDIS